MCSLIVTLKLGVREKMMKSPEKGRQGQSVSEGSGVWWLLPQAQGKLQHVVKWPQDGKLQNVVGSGGPGHACLLSQNHRMVWAERDLRYHPFPTLLPWAETPSARPGCTGLESFLYAELRWALCTHYTSVGSKWTEKKLAEKDAKRSDTAWYHFGTQISDWKMSW